MLKTKDSLDRLKVLASNLAYYPHDLDIVFSARKGYTELAILLIKNKRYNPMYSDHTMMTLELKDEEEIYSEYLKKYRICSRYYN
jgi:hypothetical protein